MSIPSPTEPLPEPTRIIRPRRGVGSLGLAALWEYRDLLLFLTKRDIQLRYRQTVLGVAWAVLQPLATMAIFTIFFGRFGKMPSDGLPYALFALCGLVPWQLFAYSLTESSNSLVANQNLVSTKQAERAAQDLDLLSTKLRLLIAGGWLPSDEPGP